MIDAGRRMNRQAVYETHPVVTLDEQVSVALSGRAMTVHVDRVGAADRIAALGAASVDPETRGQGRLAALLMRVKLHHDRRARHEAAIVFAHWLRDHREVGKWKLKSGDSLFLKFSKAVLLEWQQGRRWKATERAISLGLPMEVYGKHWPQRFDWAASELDRIESEIKRPLQRQLSRRIFTVQK